MKDEQPQEVVKGTQGKKPVFGYPAVRFYKRTKTGVIVFYKEVLSVTGWKAGDRVKLWRYNDNLWCICKAEPTDHNALTLLPQSKSALLVSNKELLDMDFQDGYYEMEKVEKYDPNLNRKVFDMNFKNTFDFT